MRYYELFICTTKYKISNDGNDKICENDFVEEVRSFKNFEAALDYIKPYSDIVIDTFSVYVNKGNCIDFNVSKKYSLLDLESDLKHPENLHDISIRHNDCKLVNTVKLEYTDLNYEKYIEKHSFELYERIMNNNEQQ